MFYLEYANPVLGMRLDELCECVVALQSSMWEIALPHVLEDDMSKI